MHVSSTKVLACRDCSVSVSPSGRSALSSGKGVLIPMIFVCTLLALLEVAASTMFDPDLLSMMPV